MARRQRRCSSVLYDNNPRSAKGESVHENFQVAPEEPSAVEDVNCIICASGHIPVLRLALAAFQPLLAQRRGTSINRSTKATNKSPRPMSTITLLRLASRSQPSTLYRASRTSSRLPVRIGAPSAFLTCSSFSTSVRRAADKDGQEAADHHEESFEEFTARYVSLHWDSWNHWIKRSGALVVVYGAQL